MKKLIATGIASAALLVSALPIFAGAKNATYAEWTWPAGTHKSAYFQTTGSGLVNVWTYDHPDMGEARYVIKPVDKFKNATECDEGWLRENPNWKPRYIWNCANADNRSIIEDIFGPGADLDKEYLFCAYPME